MELASQHLLDIQVLQPVPEGQPGQGFCSILFVIPKTFGGGMESYSGPQETEPLSRL